MLEMKMLGVALVASILIDATGIGLGIVPAALILLGERAWWPGRLDRPQGVEVPPGPEPARVGASRREGYAGQRAPGYPLFCSARIER
jgi:RND superfamily putative drug exporter